MKYYVKHMFSDHNKPIICFILGCKMHRACQRRLNPCLLINLLVYQLHIKLLQFICKLSSERKTQQGFYLKRILKVSVMHPWLTVYVLVWLLLSIKLQTSKYINSFLKVFKVNILKI